MEHCSRCGWNGAELYRHRFCPECYTPIWNFQAGQKVGPYTLERILGVGGFAEVWLATHGSLNLHRALKRLRMEELLIHWQPKSIEEFQQRFIREARVQAKLFHPNIVQVFELAEWEHEVWMVMEYCKGGNLLRYIQKNRLDINEAVEITLDILRGLAFAHRHDVIHRDIKPSNILLSEDGVWKIGDFGIAKVTSDLNLTQGGSRMGTPYYMAPEQWKDPTNVGPESDLYGVGCILYQMVEGVVPFTGESMAEVMEKHLLEKPPPMRHAPEWLETVIRKAMEKKPQNRFRSAQAMIDALTSARKLDISTIRTEQQELTISVVPQATVSEHSSWVTCVDYHPRKPWLVTGSNDWTSIIYDFEKQTIVTHLKTFYSPVMSIRSHPEGQSLAVAELKGQITLFHFDTWKPIRTLRSSDATTYMDYSPDGRFLVTGHYNGRVTLWNLDFGVPVFDELRHSGEIRGIAFSPMGETWVSVSEDGQIIFWETKSGEIKKTYRSISGPPESVAWHPHGRYVAVGTKSGVIDLWDTQYWQVAYSFQHGEVAVIGLTFHPTGDYLASAGADGEVILWESPSGAPVTKFKAHQSPVLSIRFHPSGKWLATGSVDCMARIWKIRLIAEDTSTRHLPGTP